MIEVDDSELRALAADLSRAQSRAPNLVDPVLKKAAQNVKEEMAADAAGSRYFDEMASSITYDRDTRLGQEGYEIGPDKSRGGKAGRAARLANIAYFGGANGGGGTLDIEKPLRSEEPRLMKALDDALKDVL